MFRARRRVFHRPGAWRFQGHGGISRKPVPLHTAENIADGQPDGIARPLHGAWRAPPTTRSCLRRRRGLSIDQIKVESRWTWCWWSRTICGGHRRVRHAQFSREWFRRGPACGRGARPRAGAALDAGKGTRLPAVDAQAQARRDMEEADAQMARAEGATEAEVEEERIAVHVYEAEEVEAEGAPAAVVAAARRSGRHPACSLAIEPAVSTSQRGPSSSAERYLPLGRDVARGT